MSRTARAEQQEQNSKSRTARAEQQEQTEEHWAIKAISKALLSSMAHQYEMESRFTLIKLRKPDAGNLNEELQWLGSSLGLFNLRDKDKSCFRIFIELLKNTRKNRPLSSDEIAYRLKLSRGTVIHHMKKLSEAGIITADHNKYMLRANSLKQVIDEIEKDITRLYDGIKEVADEIDSKLGH
ncbi:winged helix-turn-helix transcriptional regulator [Candidatus Woesearchaeota archaeon]|nr:winged helix-turn-helix transcriptional regulator [Candidatus Woesearchaeota archaeon]